MARVRTSVEEAPRSPGPRTWAHRRNINLEDMMSTEKQKEAARRNIETAREVQEERAHGQDVPRTSEGLSTAEEDRLPDSEFAFPKERKEPINDAAHVRNAIARFDQVEDVTDEERDEAWQRIQKAAEKYGIHMGEDNWREVFTRHPDEPKR